MPRFPIKQIIGRDTVVCPMSATNVDVKPAEKSASGDDQTPPKPGSLVSKIMRILQHYRDSASIHGIGQITDSRICKCRRALWCFLTIGAGLSLLLTGGQQLIRLAHYPKITTFKATLKESLEFPAVTICNLNQFHKQRIPDNELVKEIIFTYSEFRRVGGLLINTSIVNSSEDVSGEELSNISRNTAHRLEDMLIYCTWRLKKYPCNKLFTTRLTGRGFCHTFNYEGKFSPVSYGPGPWEGLRVMINIEREHYYYSQNLHTGVKTPIGRYQQTNDNITYGTNIWIHLFFSLSAYFSCHNVIIHEPGEGIFPAQNGYSIEPGIMTAIAISKYENRGLPPPYTAFDNDICVDTESESFVNPLTAYKLYSKTGCVNECYVNKLVDICGCTSFLEPVREPFCSGKRFFSCYLPLFESLSVEELEHCDCPRQCKSVSYTPVIHQSEFASDFVFQEIVRLNLSERFPFAVNSMVDLEVYFDTLTVKDIHQVPELSTPFILATFGGQMGLFIGASILSVIELMELALMVTVHGFISGLRRLQN